MTTTPAPSISVCLLSGTTTGPFPTGWKYNAAEDVRAYLELEGLRQPDLEAGVDYTLTGATPTVDGGTVALDAALVPADGWAEGDRLVLYRRTAKRQALALPDTEGHKPRSTEQALDKLMRSVEETADGLDLTLKVTAGEAGFTIPAPPVRAGMLMTFDEAGDPDFTKTYAQLVTDAGNEVGAEALALVQAEGVAQSLVVQGVGAQEVTEVQAAGIATAASVAAAGDAAVLDIAAAFETRDYAASADALSNGVVDVTGLVGGTGGTNGTFALAFSGGGGSGAAGVFVVAGGIVTDVTLTAAGINYATAPTISFAASAGLTGASATAVIAQNRPPGTYWRQPVASGFEVFENVAGTATSRGIIPSVAAFALGLSTAAPAPTANWDSFITYAGINSWSAVEATTQTNYADFSTPNQAAGTKTVVLHAFDDPTGAVPFSRYRLTDASPHTPVSNLNVDGDLHSVVMTVPSGKTANGVRIGTNAPASYKGQVWTFEGESLIDASRKLPPMSALLVRLAAAVERAQADIKTGGKYGGTLTTGSLNDLTGAGWWLVPGAYGDTVTDYPADAGSDSGYVINRVFGSFMIQTWKVLGEPHRTFERQIRTSTSEETEWEPVGATAGGYAPLAGETVALPGDSNVENGDYPLRLAANEGCTVLKFGFGGCRLGQHNTGSASSVHYDKMCMYNLARYIGEDAADPGYDWSELLTAADDLLTVTGGDDNTEQALLFSTTDWSQSLKMPWDALTNDFTVSSPNPLGTSASTADGTTIWGAVRYIVETLNTARPNIELGFIGPTYRDRQADGDGLNSDDNPNSLGLYLIDYVDTLIEASDHFHLPPVLDLYRHSGVNRLNHAHWLSDGLHWLTGRGWAKKARVVGAWLRTWF